MLAYAATAALAFQGLTLAPTSRPAAMVSSVAAPGIMMAAKAPVKKVVKKVVKKAPVKKVVKKPVPVKKAPVKTAVAAKKSTSLPSKVPTKKTAVPKPVNYSGRDAMPGSAITLGDIGTTAPLGVYDPLQLMTDVSPKEYRRWQELEIKHGRLSMLAITHVLVTGAGITWPGYCSYIAYDDTLKNLKWSEIPPGTIASFKGLPALGWFQIIALASIMDVVLLAQDPAKLPGEVVPDSIKETKIYQENHGNPLDFEQNLNRERNHGRAAMMGITGMIIHESLTGNPLFPLSYPFY